MKKCSLFIILLFCISVSLAQTDSNISVKSLTELSNDTEASVTRKLDSRDKKCALIKVRTPNLNADERAKLKFKGDAGTEVFLEEGIGELKLFLTEGAKMLRIMHADYGVVEYSIPIAIVGFKTYKMELMVDKGALVAARSQNTSLSANYVEINVDPADATVLIDDNPVTDGVAYLTIGEDHNLTVSKAMYHTHTQVIRASKSKKMVYNVKLTPAFGWLKIASQPEDGATVFIDGQEKGKTPMTTARLESGEHTIKLIKEMFEPLEKTVNVRDNDTAIVTLKMKGNFAEVKINIADENAEIYVDGKKKSTGTWRGRLTAGTHLVEAKRQYHTTTMKEVTCVVGVPQNLTLDNPQPIIGSLNITSNPAKAKIYLDGEDLERTTPDIIQDVYAGEHRLKIEKEGFSTYDETIIVKENEMTIIDVELASTREITISTDKTGDKIYIDDKYIGISPLKTQVRYGDVKIVAERDKLKTTKIVSVNDKTSNINIHVGATLTVTSRELEHEKWNQARNDIYPYTSVYIDNRNVGKAPYAGKVSQGEHTVMVKCGNWENKKTIYINDSIEKYDLKIYNYRMYLSLIGGMQPDVDFDISWIAGLDFDINLLPFIIASTGIHYLPFQYHDRQDINNDGYKFLYTKYQLQVIEIPLMLKLNIGGTRMFGLWGGVGISYGYNIGYKSCIAYSNSSYSPGNSYYSAWQNLDMSDIGHSNFFLLCGAGINLLNESIGVYMRIPKTGLLKDKNFTSYDVRVSIKFRIN